MNGCGKGGHLDVSCIRWTGRAAKPLGCVRGAPAYAFAARAGWCGAAAPRGTGSRGPAQPNRAWGHPLWRTAAFPLRPLRRVATRLRSDAGPAFLRGSGRRPNPSDITTSPERPSGPSSPAVSGVSHPPLPRPAARLPNVIPLSAYTGAGWERPGPVRCCAE
ncbi:hypothetical protein GCM10009605_23220 [Nocardiopsis composta]